MLPVVVEEEKVAYGEGGGGCIHNKILKKIEKLYIYKIIQFIDR